MSGFDHRIDRRGLFALFRPDPPKEVAPARPPMSTSASTSTSTARREASFSLGDFYAARTPSSAAVPTFTLREGLPSAATSHVGVERPPPSSAPADGPAMAFDGVAQIREYACLAWQRSFCSVCSERCPVPGAIVIELGRPRVVAEACTGCGTCIRVCPAPVNGFDIVPRAKGPDGDAKRGASR